jgi:Raf kinase inhibitor-like YbhB/YbcL family protein
MLEITSAAFTHGGSIPTRHTCEGEDLSPALQWSGAPEGTKSFALIVDDPDAPDPASPRMTYVHWVLYDIAADMRGLSEGAGNKPATGAREGTNDARRTGYKGPCPPIGQHRYFHKLYAVDTVFGDLKVPTKPALERALEGHILARAELMGTYQKKR